MIDVIEYLDEIGKIDTIIANKLIEVKQWKELAQKITAELTPDKVQSSSTKQKMAEAIEKAMEIEQEIDTYIVKLYEVKKDILSKIEQLEVTEYDVLHKLYVQYLPLKAVAKAYGKSYSWACDMHTKATKHLEAILSQETV